MFLRESERRPVGRETAGVVVYDPAGRRFFFPGGTVELGMILAQMTLGDDVLDHPESRIEFGENVNGTWLPEQVLQEPPYGANAKQQHNTVHYGGAVF